MGLVQPSSVSVERVFSYVTIIVASTGDKGLDDMLECCLFGKINSCNV